MLTEKKKFQKNLRQKNNFFCENLSFLGKKLKTFPQNKKQ